VANTEILQTGTTPIANDASARSNVRNLHHQRWLTPCLGLHGERSSPVSDGSIRLNTYLEFTMKMKKMLGATALLGFFLSGGAFLFEHKVNACVTPVYTDPDRCNCIAKDWGNSFCATTGDGPCFTFGTCDGGPPILLV
jgi:hypothetical protein